LSTHGGSGDSPVPHEPTRPLITGTTTRRFPMRKLSLTGLAALAAIALAAPAAASPVLQIVMKDPGCHWFKVGSKLTTKYVAHGAIALQNFDEASLKFVGPKGTVLLKVGK